MKEYDIYAVEDNNLVYKTTLIDRNVMLAFMDNKRFGFTFFVVDVYLVDRKKKTRKFSCSILYLQREKLMQSKKEIVLSQVEQAKENLNFIYCANGKVKYLPNIPISTPELIELVGGWFSLKTIYETPTRYDIVYFDDKESPRPAYNEKASNLFGMDLYGDVLLVNENLIS